MNPVGDAVAPALTLLVFGGAVWGCWWWENKQTKKAARTRWRNQEGEE